MDAFNHVNNTVYFRYFETARLAHMTKIKVMEEMKLLNIGPILASTECRFKAPVKYPDDLLVGCRVTSINDFGFEHEYAVYSFHLDRVASFGKGTIVMVDYSTGKKVPLNDSIRQAILSSQPDLLA
ncbi:MAG: thioesterase family protein [Kangiellaceae bacterium]|jgi:acyl-CoA thioester hydrolase|nr:thioesterase family protein [Kangiellaceae bacterium]